MSDNKLLVTHIRMKIEAEKSVRGEFELHDIAEYADGLGYTFDAKRAKEREIGRFCRSIISGFCDSDGDRTLLAVGRSGEYIDREVCTSQVKLQAAYKLLKKQRDGIEKTMKKTKRQIDGQLHWAVTRDGSIETLEYANM